MPRDPGTGEYTLPAGNPVTSGDTIESAWANNTMDDLKTAMTDSLSRTGKGGMLAPFLNDAGDPTNPGISWASDDTSGWRYAANNIYGVIGSADITRMSVNGFEIRQGGTWYSALTTNDTAIVQEGSPALSSLEWNDGIGEWEAVAPSGGTNVEAGSQANSILTWNNVDTWTENTNVTITNPGVVTAVQFQGPLVGNVTGNVTGSAGSAATATTADNATTADSAADSDALGGTPAANFMTSTTVDQISKANTAGATLSFDGVDTFVVSGSIPGGGTPATTITFYTGP